MKTRLFLLFLFIANLSMATTWHVGAAQTYTLPSQLVNLVQNGDSILIDGGIYLNDAVKWTKKNLTFHGLGTSSNPTILRFTIDIPNGKGIWVFETPGNCDNATIENIVFDGAQISDSDGANGAGIRFQAKDVTVRNCIFKNCQNGILEGHGAVSTSNVRLVNCEFDNNGYQLPNDPTHSGYEHHIYISASADTLWVENCYFHDPRGQANSLKTRAQRNFILYNYIDEGENGYGSYELNIAQGGLCVILGNVIVQGESGANHSIVGYDAATNAIQDFYFVNNTVINRFSGNVKYFNISPASGIQVFKVYNNIFASVGGASAAFFGTNTPSVLDSAGNFVSMNLSNPFFVDESIGNYNLTSNSPAIDFAVSAASTSTGYSLLPEFSYVSVASPLLTRTIVGAALDAGAYEFTGNASVSEFLNHSLFSVSPNPSDGLFYLKTEEELPYFILQTNGKILEKGLLHPNEPIDLSNYPSGMYFLQIERKELTVQLKLNKR